MSHPSIRAKRLTRVAGGLFVALATWAAWGAGGDIADPAAGVAIDIEPHERFRLRVRADAGQRDWLSAKGYDIAGHDLPNDRVEVLTDAVRVSDSASLPAMDCVSGSRCSFDAS